MRDQTQEVSVARSLEAKPVKKALFPSNPPQDQTCFPFLAGLPPTVSMAAYIEDITCPCVDTNFISLVFNSISPALIREILS